VSATSSIDWSPALHLALLTLVLASLPIGWVWLRRRGGSTAARLAALTAVTLFLTADLIAVGAFTRLSDSGLGCPDWPGCYGSASPIGALDDIRRAQTAAPAGPVTQAKAWIEMLHRYLAAAVGALTLVLAALSWRERRRLPHSLFWPMLTVAWVLVQGLFGRLTVTMKLFPAVVTLHLLGAMLLLALLGVQWTSHRGQAPIRLRPAVRASAVALTMMLAVQLALGAWVSSNYAVLACTGFPQCNGQWWPAMDFTDGFTIWRGLGEAGPGGARTLESLVAIQMAHRIGAAAVAALALLLAVGLRRSGAPEQQRIANGVIALLVWQLASGMTNVVLGWPLAAALAHSVGAAGWVLLLTVLLTRSATAGRSTRSQRGRSAVAIA
jgi:cytochrome c oxidase assembly protein subunit 15